MENFIEKTELHRGFQPLPVCGFPQPGSVFPGFTLLKKVARWFKIKYGRAKKCGLAGSLKDV